MDLASSNFNKLVNPTLKKGKNSHLFELCPIIRCCDTNALSLVSHEKRKNELELRQITLL